MENMMAEMSKAYERCLAQYVQMNYEPRTDRTGRWSKAKSICKLSPRESQVVAIALSGKTNKAIAIELNISEGTVKKTMHNAFVKFGVCSRNELLSLCIFDQTRYTSLCREKPIKFVTLHNSQNEKKSV